MLAVVTAIAVGSAEDTVRNVDIEVGTDTVVDIIAVGTVHALMWLTVLHVYGYLVSGAGITGTVGYGSLVITDNNSFSILSYFVG